jgi:hypothetical protein
MYVGNPSSILEVGAGNGSNLLAIKDIMPWVDVSGVEVNSEACMEIHRLDVCRETYNCSWEDFELPAKWDMVFTSGVLIHVHPDNRPMFMQKIIDYSKRYVVAIEYFSPELRAVKYHGQDEALWVDDFGRQYMQMGLKLLDCKFYYKPLTGLDNVTCWVFEK